MTSSKHTCRARIFNWDGRLFMARTFFTVDAAIKWADNYPHGSATVRGTRTSNGTEWPDYQGQVLASRDAGVWTRG